MDASELFKRKMTFAGIPQPAVDMFLYFYEQFRNGETGLIPESTIDPVDPESLETYCNMEKFESLGKQALDKTAVIKLNGGLGTTMGLQSAKSLISVKNGLTFLDITALQIRALNRAFGKKIPFLLMDSFKTHEETASALTKYKDLDSGLPFSFIQHKFPRILASTLMPVENPANPVLEWNPPGHGDLYTALVTSGLLDNLLSRGYRHAFVSNIDNLGATLDPAILGYFICSGVEGTGKGFSFLMEVTERTEMDRKGGHLARSKQGKLLLREASQCHEEDESAFRDISRHRFFNTNNLWINLESLKSVLAEGKPLRLPLIRNKKKLDPLDNASPDVFQLESAMGSAISVFDDSAALIVPRDRFAPVKNCEELLLLWSDYYIMTDDYKVLADSSRACERIGISLDRNWYGRLDQLLERFPFGAPSLVRCKCLVIEGDVRFGKGVVISGTVTIRNTSGTQAQIRDHSIIQSDIIFS